MVINLKNVALATMSHIVWRGAFVLAGILIFRLRSQHDFAIFQFFNITAVSMAAYGGLGLSQAATRFLASSNGEIPEDRYDHASMILRFGLVLSFVAGVIAFFLVDALLGDASEFRIQFSLLTAVYLYAGVVDGGMVGLGRFKWLFFSNACGATVLLVSFFFLAADLSLSEIIWLFCVAPLISLMMNMTGLLRIVRPWRRRLPAALISVGVLKDVFSFSFPLFLTGFVFVSVPWVFGRVLQGTPEMVGAFSNFSIGLQWFALVLLVPSMVTRVVAPQVFVEVDSGQVARVLLKKRALLNAIIAACFAIILMLKSPFILALYGAEAAAAKTDMIVMSVAAVFASTVGVVGTYVMAVDGGMRWLLFTFIWGSCAIGMFFGLLLSDILIVSLGYLTAYIVLAAAAWSYVLASSAVQN